jgi:hypothetical protein
MQRDQPFDKFSATTHSTSSGQGGRGFMGLWNGVYGAMDAWVLRL